MAVKNTLGKIRKEAEMHVGEKVKLRANRGRRKTFEKWGLRNTYPSILWFELTRKLLSKTVF